MDGEPGGENRRRVKELGERYGATLPDLAGRVADLEKAVAGHLISMGVGI